MSTTKVTDFFSTRKRGRFNQDDVLLNKQKKTQSLVDPTDVIGIEKAKLIKAVETELIRRSTRSTRSRKYSARQEEDNKTDENEAPQDPEPETPPAPIQNEPEKKLTRGQARKAKMDELKKKMTRLDDKLSKVKEVAPKPVEAEVKAAPPVEKSAKGKQKIDRTELKAKIQNFNNKLLAVQDTIEKKKEADVAKLGEEPVVSGLAAFEKHKNLASADIDIKCTLTLPCAYARVLDAFKGSDTIVKFLTNRQETCTFLKLKLGIQNITKHTFTLKHLAQVKTVYPLAYYYKQEKMFIDFKNDYHLTIHPNLDEVTELNAKGLKDFSPNILLTRLNKFKANLFSLVKNCHQKFLESIGITNVEFKDIKRWHPKFDLESCCPDIEESELPKSPNESVKVKTGQDLLNIAKDVYSSRIQDAIKEHNKEAENNKLNGFEIEGGPLLVNKLTDVKAAPVEPVASVVKEIAQVEKKLTKDEQVLKDLKQKKEKNYNSLLEKIRNKEKTKAFESMIINSDKEKNLVKYGLYKDSIRFLVFYFQAEKKSTIDMEKILAKLADNLKEKITDTECRDLLNEMLNDKNLHEKWITSIRVRNLTYIKMDKSFQMNDLWAKCDKLIADLK